MQKRFLILVASLSICWASCTANKPNRPPDLDGMMIVQAFHHCSKCHSMVGGIHGKGPKKSIDGAGRGQCVHNWIEIDGETFRTTATELYGIDWTAEPAFYWNRGQ